MPQKSQHLSGFRVSEKNPNTERGVPMMDEALKQYMMEYEVIYMIVVHLKENCMTTYGDKEKLLYDGLVKTYFYDMSTIDELNRSITGEERPQIYKQGKVVCVIGKPDPESMVGIFYHNHRAPKEFMAWSQQIYHDFLAIWH